MNWLRRTCAKLQLEVLESRFLLDATLQGVVFIDANLDGIRDAGEIGVPGVLLSLSGVDLTNNAVRQTMLTGDDGVFRFTELPDGIYEVMESQPHALTDGLESISSADAEAGDDVFSKITLTDGQQVNVSFGELGLLPDLSSIAWFFASATEPMRLFREVMAVGEEQADNAELAQQIREQRTFVTPQSNRAPQVMPDHYAVDEDGTLEVGSLSGVLANDGDVDMDALTAQLASPPASGTLDLQQDGTFVYVPNANFNGTDVFSYRADDGTTASPAVEVRILVTPVNDAPQALDDQYTLNEDSVLSISEARGLLANDEDVDGDALTAVLATSPSEGSLSLRSDGTFTYIPTDDFFGSDSFSYEIVDAEGVRDEANVRLTVLPINDVPSALPRSFQVNADSVLTVETAAGLLAGVADADQDPLIARLISQPTRGLLALNSDGSFRYTPQADGEATDQFQYVVNDGTVDSATATVDIQIKAVDLPLALDDDYRISPGNVLQIDTSMGVLANDQAPPSNEPLTVSRVAGPENGSIELRHDGSFRYTPEVGFRGVDSFRYRIDTVAQLPIEGLVTILVNTAPTGTTDAYFVDEDSVLVVAAAEGLLQNDSDENGDPLATQIVIDPRHGRVSLSADGSFVYTPDSDFHGTDEFVYRASDGLEHSDPTTVRLQVAAVNDPPRGAPDSYLVREDTGLVIEAEQGLLKNDVDVEGDQLTVQLMRETGNGGLTIEDNGSFRYTPNRDFFGTDTFTYIVSDGTESSSEIPVTLEVEPVNDAPELRPPAYEGTEDTPLLISAADGLLAHASDVDGDPLFARVVRRPSQGTINVQQDGSFRYAPPANFAGVVTFEFLATDTQLDSPSVTAAITVAPVEDPPVAQDDMYQVEQFRILQVSPQDGVFANDQDPDGDPLSANLLSTPQHGRLSFSIVTGAFTYVPNGDFAGMDSFTYTLSDGQHQSDAATVRLAVREQIPRSIELTASRDTTLYENELGRLANGSGKYLFVGKTKQELESLRRGLVALDLTRLPAGAVATQATLRMQVSKTIQEQPSLISVHRLLSDWGEGNSDAPAEEGGGTRASAEDATWIHTHFARQLWASPGGDFLPTASAVAAVGGSGSYDWSSATLVDDVQQWINEPHENFGWILVGDETSPSSRRFASRESLDAGPPTLVIEYLQIENGN